MSISLELIEKLKERAHISYTEAKEALEKCNGDLLEALIYLEKEDKIKTPSNESKLSGFGATVKKWVKTCNATKLVISKDNATVVNVSMSIVILVTLFFAPLTIAALLAALFTRHKIRIEKEGCADLKINQTLSDISNAASKVSDQFTVCKN